MARILSLAALAASASARFPSAQPGTLESLSASAQQPGELTDLQAMGVKGLGGYKGKSLYVKASIHFLYAGELVQQGEIVEMPEDDAKRLVRFERATLATDDEVGAAQKAAA